MARLDGPTARQAASLAGRDRARAGGSAPLPPHAFPTGNDGPRGACEPGRPGRARGRGRASDDLTRLSRCAGRAIWIAAAAFFVVTPPDRLRRATDAAYLLGKHSVTALKLLEYALMAPALIVRTRRDFELLSPRSPPGPSLRCLRPAPVLRRDRRLLIGHKRAGGREPFLGPHDFAAPRCFRSRLQQSHWGPDPARAAGRSWRSRRRRRAVPRAQLPECSGSGSPRLATGSSLWRTDSLVRAAGLAGIVGAVRRHLDPPARDVSQFLKFLGIRPGPRRPRSAARATAADGARLRPADRRPPPGVRGRLAGVAYEDAYALSRRCTARFPTRAARVPSRSIAGGPEPLSTGRGAQGRWPAALLALLGAPSQSAWAGRSARRLLSTTGARPRTLAADGGRDLNGLGLAGIRSWR